MDKTKLYPSIPPATEEDLAIDLSLYAHPANDDRVRAIARLAAHHARLAEIARRELIEARGKLAKAADADRQGVQDHPLTPLSLPLSRAGA